jgi:hypothetical protein
MSTERLELKTFTSILKISKFSPTADHIIFTTTDLNGVIIAQASLNCGQAYFLKLFLEEHLK